MKSGRLSPSSGNDTGGDIKRKGKDTQEDKKNINLLTSVIILQLLHGPIWVKSCRIKISVTSLERFPTYLEGKEVVDFEKASTVIQVTIMWYRQ